MERKRRKRKKVKSRTITGQRIPIELHALARKISTSRGVSLQDAYRLLARRLG